MDGWYYERKKTAFIMCINECFYVFQMTGLKDLIFVSSFCPFLIESKLNTINYVSTKQASQSRVLASIYI